MDETGAPGGKDAVRGVDWVQQCVLRV